MPARKKAVTDPQAVLEGGTPQAPSVDDSPGEQETEEHDNNDSVLTPEQIELAELRAQLEETKSRLASKESAERGAKADYRPVPEEELTAEQREIRMLKDQLARRNGKDDRIEEHFEDADGGIVVHFLADGLTSNNRVFYRGQEVIFGPAAYDQTRDRFGDSWLDLNESEQVERYGEIKFRKGPWPGKRTYDEEALKNVSITEKAPVLNI